jgi:HPt (histidine-containing phosphotransfer) domain-containing protein
MREKTGASSIERGALDGIRLLEAPGGRGLLDKVLVLYLADSLKHMKRIRESVETGEADSLLRACHSLKSSSGNVGAAGLSEICRKIEAGAGAGVLPAAGDSLIDKLEEEYRSVREDLEAILETGKTETAGDR